MHRSDSTLVVHVFGELQRNQPPTKHLEGFGENGALLELFDPDRCFREKLDHLEIYRNVQHLKGEVTAVHPKFRHFGPDSGGRYDAHKWSQIDFLSKYMIFEILIFFRKKNKMCNHCNLGL